MIKWSRNSRGFTKGSNVHKGVWPRARTQDRQGTVFDSVTKLGEAGKQAKRVRGLRRALPTSL